MLAGALHGEAVYLFATVGIGVTGSVAAKRFSFPAYALLGALIATGIYNVITGNASFPTGIRPLIQVIAGIFIGARVTRGELEGMKGAYKPILINLAVTISYSLAFGYVLYRMTDASFVTTAFATAPGGIMDITLVGMDMGADMGFVTTMQMVRVMTVISVFPLIINRFLKKSSNRDMTDHTHTTKKLRKAGSVSDMAVTLAVGGIAGFIGYLSGLPAMPLLAAMFGVAVQNVFFDNAYLPPKVKIGVQVGAGILIGQTLTAASVLALGQLIIPTFVMMSVYIMMTLTLGTLLYGQRILIFLPHCLAAYLAVQQTLPSSVRILVQTVSWYP